MSGTHYPQFCALARATEILGERWTLLIVRELLIGQKRFSDLQARLCSVSPTVLTSRLNALIEAGVVHQTTLPAPFNANVYELTPVGAALRPVVYELIRWGGNFLFPMRKDDEFDPDWALLGLDAIARRESLPETAIALRIRHKSERANFVVRGGPNGATIVKGEAPVKALIEARFETLLQIIAGALQIDQAIADRLIQVEGSLSHANALPSLFSLRQGPG